MSNGQSDFFNLDSEVAAQLKRLRSEQARTMELFESKYGRGSMAEKLLSADRFWTNVGAVDQIKPLPGDLTLPSGGREPGGLSGKNGLYRMNWFNGRFLTGEALRSQDIYWDQRSRFVAQTHAAGVTWGLDLRYRNRNLPGHGEISAAHNKTYARDKGRSLDDPVQLSPGLAFNDIGEPISVGATYEFTLRDLIESFQARPRQVIGGGTQFAPCVCLDDPGVSIRDPGPGPRPGPYLLVIEPGELPEGEAKVYGEICATGKSVQCQADGWRGCFLLSLARFPQDVPASEPVTSAWDLRGLLSAYYFDVHEHNLVRRWDPDFALNDDFCAATGPFKRGDSAVPLAMVYLGHDGSVLFLDPWIPRRSQAGTVAEAWSANLLGAPTPSAVLARQHQFQCQLAESLSVAPFIDTSGGGSKALNLHQRGFRHIPPAGFLPIDVGQIARLLTDPSKIKDHVAFGDLVPAGGFGSLLIETSRRLAGAYFKGTTVFPYFVVALHDDDVLEDFNNVRDKDPLVIDELTSLEQLFPDPAGHGKAVWYNTYRQTKGDFQVLDLSQNFYQEVNTSRNPLNTFFLALTRFLALPDYLINREIELVKIVIPLQGLRRRHPVIGRLAEDWRSLFEAWFGGLGATVPPGAEVDPQLLLGEFMRQGKISGAPPAYLPRHFVVYVKQRIVLLDAIFLLLEALKGIIRFAQFNQAAVGGGSPMNNTGVGRTSPEERDKIRAAMAVPLIQDAIVDAMLVSSEDLGVAKRWDRYWSTVDELDEKLAQEIPDPEARRLEAQKRSAAALAEEHEGFAVVASLLELDAGVQVESVLRRMQRDAEKNPVVDSRGRKVEVLARDEVFLAGGVKVFGSDRGRSVWTETRKGLGGLTVKAIVPSLDSDATVDEVMARTPDKASELLGGADNYKKLVKALSKNADTLAKGAEELGTVTADENLVKRFEAHKAQANGDPLKAFEETKREFSGDAAATAYLKKLEPFAKTLGREGFDKVTSRLFASSPGTTGRRPAPGRPNRR